MSRGTVGKRWIALLIAVLLPIAAGAAYGYVRWGRLAAEAVQVAMKMAVIP